MLQVDLARLWEEHTRHEFSTRDTESTLATMVDDAYVNHVPVLTGAVGKDALRIFYSVDFIPTMPRIRNSRRFHARWETNSLSMK
jgi:carboxymethylenebutenolidase